MIPVISMIVDDSLSYEYTHARIRRILYRWPEYLALAETPASAAGLTVDGPTPESPRIRQIGHHSDPLAWSNLVADIERAWTQLTLHSLEWRTVEVLMQGKRLDAFAKIMHLDIRDVEQGLDRAVVAMLMFLNHGLGSESYAVVNKPICAAPDCANVVEHWGRFCSARCRLKTWRMGR